MVTLLLLASSFSIRYATSMRISFSSFDTYKTCPLKYKFANVDGVKEPKSANQVFGSLLHTVLEYIHKPGFTSPTLDEAMEFYAQHFDASVFQNEMEERGAFAQGVEIIQKYYAKNKPGETNVVDLESRFAVELDDPKNPGVKHIISGIIDRIDKTPSGYEIIDYKTARKMPAQQIIDDNVQLSIYTRALLKRYPNEKNNLHNIIVSLYFLRHGTKLSSKRSAEQLKEVDEAFLEVIRDIENKKFDPQVGPLCDYCGYQKLCPMWRHKFKEERKVETKEVQDAIFEYIAIKEKSAAERKHLAELQEIITRYMDQEGVERVFGETKLIERTVRKTYTFDQEKLQAILEPKGLWEKVLKIDGMALRKVAGELPLGDKKRLDTTKQVDKESKGLTVKRK